MSNPISWLRDDFEDNSIAPTWAAYPYASGSATRSETSGDARITLPSSTAGTHENGYYSAATYDLTNDGAFINIVQMVATGVAAYALWGFLVDANTQIRWFQQSNTIKAQKIVGGVTTDLYSATWSSTTYKYLRIRESGGNLLFDSSSNGTSWTNRHTTTGLPIAITDLHVQIVAGCGNVASPGTFQVEDFNPILPALSSTWHWTQVEWNLLYRFRSITIAATSGQGYIATSNDGGATWQYYSGPLGSGSGGYNQLTSQASQAAAQAAAVNLPLDGRWDLPAIVECRTIRLYHRSTTGTTYRLDEYYPRRLVQSDDVEAESIKAINIAAASITADRLFVLQLSAITANIGGLNIDLGGYLWQGTGSAAAPTTGLKIFNSGGIGKLSTYNATVEQITLDTDGKFKWGAGAGLMDAAGMRIIQGASILDLRSLALTKADGTTVIGRYGGGYATSHGLFIEGTAISGEQSFVDVTARAGTTDGAITTLRAVSGTAAALITLTSDGATPTIALSASGGTTISGASGGLNVGTTGAGAGEIRAGDKLRLNGVTTMGMRMQSSAVVNNGAAIIPTVAGLLLIYDSTGAAAIFTIRGAGNATQEMVDPNGVFSSTQSTASSSNIYWSAGNSRYEIENKRGSTVTYSIYILAD